MTKMSLSLVMFFFVLPFGHPSMSDSNNNTSSLSAVTPSDLSTVQLDNCTLEKLPEGVFEWKGPLTLLPWGQSSTKDFCHSANFCLHLNSTPDVAMTSQMRPVFVQPNDVIELRLEFRVGGTTASLETYLVDRAGFEDCDHSRGQLLTGSARSGQGRSENLVIRIPAEKLHLGSNFIIGLELRNAGLRREAIDCENGLRLNITVKQNSCQSPMTADDDEHRNGSASTCSNRSRCVTRLHSETFFCEEFPTANNCLPLPLASSSSSSSSSSSPLSSLPSLLPTIPTESSSSSSSSSPYVSSSLSLIAKITAMTSSSSSSSLSSLFSSSSSLSSSSLAALSTCNCESGQNGENCRCAKSNNDNKLTTTESSVVAVECSPRCLPGSTCVANSNGDYECRCSDDEGEGDDGQDGCDNADRGQRSDACASNPCHHGICVTRNSGYQCYCIPGFGGLSCQVRFEQVCSREGLCMNGGTCHEGDDPGTYRCDCPDGFGGHDCSVKNDLCLSNPCAHICLDYGSYYTCECNRGFKGERCEVNVDECESNPCHNAGKCRDHVSGYRCQCAAGFHGTHCEHHSMSEMTIFVSSHRPQLHSLGMVAGTLAGAVLIAVSVVLGCYCKVNGLYKLIVFKKRGYQKQFEEDSDPSSRSSSYLRRDSRSGPERGYLTDLPCEGSGVHAGGSRLERGGGGEEGSSADMKEVYLDVAPLVETFRSV